VRPTPDPARATGRRDPRRAVSWRRRWYRGGRQRSLGRPVVSVGNISSGGRGKTPLVGHLASLLIDAGERPSVLSRGYGRLVREDGVVVVSDGTRLCADLDRSGDEPLMLARALPGTIVAVCEQRALAGTLAEHALGATVHLLDDGFQHFPLARDADIVVVSRTDLTDRRMPAGRLREPVSALVDADAVVVDAAEEPAGDGRALESAVRGAVGPGCPPVFRLTRRFGPIEALEPDFDGTVPRAGDPVVAVAGLARPERFFRAVEAAGWSVVETLAFADHHRYRARDLEVIRAACRRTGAAGVITTAKDAVRLRPWRPLRLPVAILPLVVTVEPADEFRAWLFARLREARP